MEWGEKGIEKGDEGGRFDAEGARSKCPSVPLPLPIKDGRNDRSGPRRKTFTGGGDGGHGGGRGAADAVDAMSTLMFIPVEHNISQRRTNQAVNKWGYPARFLGFFPLLLSFRGEEGKEGIVEIPPAKGDEGLTGGPGCWGQPGTSVGC